MFLLISGGHNYSVHQYGVSIQSSTKVREMFRQITQKLWATKTWDLDKIIYILVFYKISFLLASSTGRFTIDIFMPCLLRDVENEE